MTTNDTNHENDDVEFLNGLAANNEARREAAEAKQQQLNDGLAAQLLGTLATRYKSNDLTVERLEALVNGTPIPASPVDSTTTDGLRQQILDLEKERNTWKNRAQRTDAVVESTPETTPPASSQSESPQAAPEDTRTDDQKLLELLGRMATKGQRRLIFNILKKEGEAGAFAVDETGQPVIINGYVTEITGLRERNAELVTEANGYRDRLEGVGTAPANTTTTETPETPKSNVPTVTKEKYDTDIAAEKDETETWKNLVTVRDGQLLATKTVLTKVMTASAAIFTDMEKHEAGKFNVAAFAAMRTRPDQRGIFAPEISTTTTWKKALDDGFKHLEMPSPINP